MDHARIFLSEKKTLGAFQSPYAESKHIEGMMKEARGKVWKQ